MTGYILKDGDGHLYFVPKHLKERFGELLRVDEDEEPFLDTFDQYRLDSHLSCYLFTLEGEDP